MMSCIDSDAPSGWAGLAVAHVEFGSSVSPITTMGADYAHHITASPPGFENPAASLNAFYMFVILFKCHGIQIAFLKIDLSGNSSNEGRLYLFHCGIFSFFHTEYKK